MFWDHPQTQQTVTETVRYAQSPRDWVAAYIDGTGCIYVGGGKVNSVQPKPEIAVLDLDAAYCHASRHLHHRWSVLVLRDILYGRAATFNALLKSPEGIGARRLSDSLEGLLKGGILIAQDVPRHKQKRRYHIRAQVVSGVTYYLALLASVGLTVVDEEQGRRLIDACLKRQPDLDFMGALYSPPGQISAVERAKPFTVGRKHPVCAIDAAARVFCDARDMTVLKHLLMKPDRPMAEIRRAQESLSPRRWQIGLDRLIAKQLIDDQLNPLWGPQHLYAVTPLGSNAIVMFAAVAAVLHQLFGEDGLIDPLHCDLFATSSRAEDWARVVAWRDRIAREADRV